MRSSAPPQGSEKPSLSRLGLYGGSFDPVHTAHLLVALAAVEELQLERIFFIPAAQSPFKPGQAPAPAAARLRWLRLALAGESRFAVDEREIRRGGTSYSVETVREYREQHPHAEMFWLIGADQLTGLPSWKEAPVLARELKFLVIPRPGHPCTSADPRFRLIALRGWPTAISSSLIRERLRNRLTIKHLVPEHVAEDLVREPWYSS